MVTLSCQPIGHRFCKECFGNYCSLKISEALVDTTSLMCPLEDCQTPITPHELRAHVTEENYQKFERFGLRNLCSLNDWKNCPHCNNWFAEIPTDEGSVSVWSRVHCQNESCGREFCGKCGQAPHVAVLAVK